MEGRELKIHGPGLTEADKHEVSDFINGFNIDAQEPAEGEVEKSAEIEQAITETNQYREEIATELGLPKPLPIVPAQVHLLTPELFHQRYPQYTEESWGNHESMGDGIFIKYDPETQNMDMIKMFLLHEGVHIDSFRAFFTKNESGQAIDSLTGETRSGYVSRKPTKEREVEYFIALNEATVQKTTWEKIGDRLPTVASNPSYIPEVQILDAIIDKISKNNAEDRQVVWERIKKGLFTGEMMHLREISKAYGPDALRRLADLTTEDPQATSEALKYFLAKESIIEFSEVEITPDKDFNFSLILEKKPIEIKDGDTLGGNYSEVKFEGKLAELMSQAAELKSLPEKERIVKVIELVRANLVYPYSEIINNLKQTNPDTGQWLATYFGDDASIINGVKVNDCLDRGYGNCKIMSAAFLTLAQAAGLKGMFAQNGEDKVKNLIRPDTGNPMFKMGDIGKEVNFSHAWAEIQLEDGSWVPVDLTANMVGNTPEMLEFFKQANYKTQVPVIFDNMPNGLDREPPAVKFEPGQVAGKFNMTVKVRRITSMARSGAASKPAIDKYKGELKLFLVDSQESKAANLSI